MSDKHTPDLRMDAYYYGFGLTGIHAVDLILSAVACAGKAFHHTDCWFDESTPYEGHSGSTPVEWIQNAGNAAAEQFAKINSINVELLEVCEEFSALYGRLWDMVDGSGYLSPDSIKAYDAAHEKLRAVIAKARGES